ncbi:multidrug ABC transporter permease/ATP-binding protein [Neisseria sp. Ec49-e6-T10]|uniref:multidrug ABC transporter permease/ATP-binding protein n=1 Tax=Neisseria sp. Ec49-e6-T10 TaxID=3140744 RepID=UPI003EB96130
MSLLYTVLKTHKLALIQMLILTMISSLFGTGILMFINSKLLNVQSQFNHILWQFVLMLVVYLLVATLAQITLTNLGHTFVYELRKQFIKRIMDTDFEHIQRLGKAKIMASITNDILSITHAFVRLPELLQGGVFVLCASIYLFLLSPSLFAVTGVWIVATLIGGHWTVKKVYAHLNIMRGKHNQLQQHYESVLDGHKELVLNRYRAQHFYDVTFDQDAKIHKHHIARADHYHAFAGNWTNVMMLGAVGFILYLSIYHGWASIPDAITIALAVLFIRTPLISAIGAFPTFLQGKISLKAIEQLQLSIFEPDFNHQNTLFDQWQSIEFKGVCYRYGKNKETGSAFSVGPIDFTLNRGETIFLIGANGSGKSTLSMLLTGLYQPLTGSILVDQQTVNQDNIFAYRSLFSSVFTDFHLFNQLLDGLGQDVSEELIEQWLNSLQLTQKVQIKNQVILNPNLSQGQRKRLALLSAALEQKSILVLDEWAADQDPYFRQIFYEQLLPILRNQGHTVFAISHDDKYFKHADRIVKMDQGKFYSVSEKSIKHSFENGS